MTGRIVRLLTLGALALAASPAAAAAQGIDLSWKDCVGTGNEAQNQNFTCTGTVNQNYDLIFQFRPPTDLPSFVGMAVYADYQAMTQAPLPPFWHFESPGCNNPPGGIKGLATFASIALLPNCETALSDPWAEGGITDLVEQSALAYGPDFHRPGNGYFIFGVWRGEPRPLASGARYYAFHFRFNNRNRGTCAGCSDPGVIVFQKAQIESNDGTPVVELTTPDQGNQCVTINGGSPSLCGVVPIRRTRWGWIKSLYR